MVSRYTLAAGLVLILPLVIDGGLTPQLRAATAEVLYAPEDQPGEKVVILYQNARHYIYLAIYALTYPAAVRALVAAKKRGVDVRVITDRERLTDQKQRVALDTLRLAGIPIRINQHENLMHLKQVVVDDRVNASGSMNQTTSGNQYNDERLDIMTDAATTQKAKQKFLRMWTDPVRFTDWSGDVPMGR